MIRRNLLGLATALLALGLGAVSGGGVAAQAVAQGYGADSQISPGIIVQLEPQNSNKVEPLSQASASKMFGVVVDANAQPVTLSSGAAGTQVYVSTGSTNNVLVSNQNGPINAGDYITISSLDGTGMKANTEDQFVLGKAAASFDGQNGVLNTATLKNSQGRQINVSIGRIPVAVTIGRNPLYQNSQTALPGFIERASQGLTNKPVNTTKAYLGLIILLISAFIAGSLLYAGVRNSFIAVGRNPLAKKSIVRNLIQVTLTSLIIFIIGLFAVYLLLKL